MADEPKRGTTRELHGSTLHNVAGAGQGRPAVTLVQNLELNTTGINSATQNIRSVAKTN